jgi:ubiquinone/menaquinone biosynthesis C-methylase UbiE
LPVGSTSRCSEPVLIRKFSSEEVVKEYSRITRIYGLWARLTETKAVKRAFKLADIHDGESVLEVAVGTGQTFLEIVKNNQHGRNEGIDLTPTMLLVTKSRLKGIDPASYHLLIANAYDLPFNEGEFDLVINNYMLDLLPESDFDKVLGEFFRVLRPSGRLVVVTMAFGKKRYNHIWHWVARYFPSLLASCRPVAIEKYVLAKGFKNVKVEELSQNTLPSQIIVATKTAEYSL